MNDRIQQAKDYPIIDLAYKLGIEVVHNTKCKCINPNHDDKHPSMSFDIKRNRFRCFSCGIAGDTIELVKVLANITFLEAINYIIGDNKNDDIKIKIKPIINDDLLFFCDKCNRKINKLAWLIFSNGNINKYCDHCATQVYNLIQWENLYKQSLLF